MSRREQRNFKNKATIDLHGISIDKIDEILTDFCLNSIMYDFNQVIIITGKGKGIIKAETINWLKNNTHIVIKYFEIKDSKNASGSLGILLRKKWF